MPRMNILNAIEREAFDSPPVFNSFQRKQYFDFPSKLRRFAAGLRNAAYQLGFLLSAGYFKAARRFFSPGSFHPRDIEYVARQLEPGAPTVDFAQYHPRARQRHQHTIRTFYGFRARGLYDQLSPTLQSLALMPGGIRYYAESVLRSEIFQLTRRDDPDRYLHVIAFIAHQFYRLQDNLVDVLLTSLRSFQNGAIREHKEQCYARREQQHEALKTLLGGLERGLVGTLTSIGSITEDQALSDTEKVTRIRALLATRENRRLLEEDPVAELKASLVSELDEDDYYKILELKSVWIQNRVSPILKALTFQGDPDVRKLVDAIEHFKEKDGGVDRSAPTGFLDPEEQTAVNRDGKFRVSLYKALLFLQVQNGIKSGALNLEHSYKYRPLDDYLIDRDRWQRAKQQLIERAGLEGFVDPRKTLKELDEALYQQYLFTDRNIAEGKNPHITFKKNGGFTLSTPKQEESDAEPLQQYFPDPPLQKPPAPAVLYLQKPQGGRPLRLEDQARWLHR